MKKIFIISLLVITCICCLGQQVTLTFTGRDANNNYCQLDRVVITNLTHSWQETINWPDTTLTMQHGTGIEDCIINGRFGLFQNNPNPFNGTTEAELNIVTSDAISMEITDINGRIVVSYNSTTLQTGKHHFLINVSDAGIYFLTAYQNGQTSSVKMVNKENGTSNKIEYIGPAPLLKNEAKGNTTNLFMFGDRMEYVGYATINGEEVESQRITQEQGSSQTFQLNFPSAQYYLPSVATSAATQILQTSATVGGNVLDDGYSQVTERGICFNTNGNPNISDSSIILGNGIGSFSGQITNLNPATTYFIRAYATNIAGTSYGEELSFTTVEEYQDSYPCPSTPTVTDYDGNVYNTVQIGQQCWMKENLRVKHYSDGSNISISSASSYDIPYYRPPADDTSYVREYGLLYNWKAAMKNYLTSDNNPSGVQGICPNGWHLPSKAEITQLTSYVSSNSQYVCGTDSLRTAKALASENGWLLIDTTTHSDYQCTTGYNSDLNNATGFSALPADIPSYIGIQTFFWSSTWTNNTSSNVMKINNIKAHPINNSKRMDNYCSIRCIKNDTNYSEQTFDSVRPCPNNETVTDYDGNIYNTVQIGQQCWMKENLKTTHFSDGTYIPLSYFGGSMYDDVIYRYNPNNTESQVDIYGCLYNWSAAARLAQASSSNPSYVQGVCPDGWHLPSDAEWQELEIYAGMTTEEVSSYEQRGLIAARLCDSDSWPLFSEPFTPGNRQSAGLNLTGLSLICTSTEGIGNYWTASICNNDNQYRTYRHFEYNSCAIQRSGLGRSQAFSVRCVLNDY